MNKNWIGVMVSVNCKANKGTYQGQISEVKDSWMTLIKAFHNGVPHPESEVTINASDIEELKLIDSQPHIANGRSTVTVAKPVAKRLGRSISISECTLTNKSIQNIQFNTSKNQQGDIELKINDLKSTATPNKKDKSKMKWKDEACFGSCMDKPMLEDFDFEKNLALFNKEAVWQEINASQRPDVINQVDQCHKSQKYRHDENIITTIPAAYRQILVPAPDAREYVSDDGLIIPSITPELHRQLFTAAEKRGLSAERHIEMMGRAATEMALGLLGGGHRLNPNNIHQWPNVAILCGAHRQGAVGVNCARHLANHGVNTVVHVIQPDSNGLVKNEFALYKMTKNKMTSSATGLPSTTDLIIIALRDNSDNPETFGHLADWINQNRAPVLAIDPPASGIPGIITKFSLVSILPLSHSLNNGKLYLCDLGFPQRVFKDVGIKYKSPFGPKFVIPLYPNDA